MLFAKGPPPAEAREPGKSKVRVTLTSQFFNKIEHRVERFFGSSIVRTNADVATEFKHGGLLVRLKAGFLEHHHSFGFAEDIVVKRSLGDSVLGGRLSKAHLLRDHGFDRLL